MQDIGKSIPYRFRGRNLQHNEKYIQIGLEEDNRVNTITFILDRYYQGIDLNDFDVQLLLTGSFMPEPQADILTVNNGLVKEVDRATITLKWTVTINHTSQKGVGAGQFRFISASEEVWSTDVFGLMVGNSLEVDEVIEALFPSIISNHTARISAFEEALGNIYTKSEINALLDGKVDKVDGKELSTNDFTDDLKSAYDNAVSLAHKHSNKDVIDQITEQTKSEYDEAVEKKHSHINKDVLDAIEAVYTQAEKDKLAGIDENINDRIDAVKTYIDTNFRTKDETYTKDEIYTKDETYTKSEIEVLISNATYVVDTYAEMLAIDNPRNMVS